MDDRAIGRAAFLGVVGAGRRRAVLRPRRDWGSSGGSSPNTVEAIVPTSGWRIYTIGNSISADRPGGLPAHDRGRRRAAGRPTRSPTSARLPAARAGLRLPLRHGLERLRRPLGAASGSATCSRRRPAARSAKALRFVSDEVPYDDTLTLAQAFAPDAMLASSMDGKPLSAPHGFPARVVMPRMYGYKSVKWVTPDRGRDATTTASATGSSAATTRTPGSAPRTACEHVRMIRRFGVTERVLHWVHATGFLAMLATG